MKTSRKATNASSIDQPKSRDSGLMRVVAFLFLCVYTGKMRVFAVSVFKVSTLVSGFKCLRFAYAFSSF